MASLYFIYFSEEKRYWPLFNWPIFHAMIRLYPHRCS